MELDINLLKEPKKSLFRVILGIIFLSVAVAWFIVIGKETMQRPTPIWILLYVNFVLFVINGVLHIAEGLGYSFERFFGKAYILVNSDVISLKASAFGKEQFIKWSEIDSIDYKLNKIKIKKIDNTVLIINLTKFDYVLLTQIKKAVSSIAKEKNIQSNF